MGSKLDHHAEQLSALGHPLRLSILRYVLQGGEEGAAAGEIQAHVDSCSSCLSAYDLERLVKTLVSRSCAERAPEPLRERVLMSIRQVQVRIELQD